MKRGLFKTGAIVLNSFDYGESDRILTFYTHDFGKLRGIAKGARRSKKRFVGNLDPMSCLDMVFFHSDKSELVRVEEAKLADAFPGLKADIDALSIGCYLLELTSEMTREGQRLPQVYNLLAGFLKAIEEGADPGAYTRFFEIRLLSMLGYLPHLDACVVCRKTDAEPQKRFSSERGGVVCRPCSTGASGLIPVSSATAGMLAISAKLDFDKLERLKPNAAFMEEGERLLYDFIKFQIGKELKTKRFLEKMRKAEARV